MMIITALLLVAGCIPSLHSLPTAQPVNQTTTTTTTERASIASSGARLAVYGYSGKIYYAYSGGDSLGYANYASQLGHTPALKNEFMTIDSNGFSDSRWANQYVTDVARAYPNAMVMLTLQPFSGLSQLTSTTYSSIAQACIGWNQLGIRVFLRFAHEMNGDWYAWGSKPDEYKAAFRALAGAVSAARYAAGAKKLTMMLWSPNVAWDGMKNKYLDFYPGDDVVDWVGLSLYYFNSGIPAPDAFSKAITSGNGQNFYDMFCVQRGKPMVISETSAPVPLGTSVSDELARKRAWWRQLYSVDTATRFPRLRMISWFEYSKLGKTYGLFASSTIRDAFLADLPSSVMVYAG